MEHCEFISAYNDRLDISSIPWEDFPPELQLAGLHFMNTWKDELPTRHLRELSGFDDMNLEDLLTYANGVKSGQELFGIQEVYSYSEWAVGTYRAKDGEEYQITLNRSYDRNIGFEQREVLNIEKAGIEISEEDPIWKEVKLAVK